MIMTKIKNNSIIKQFVYRTPFRPVHIGGYLREKYFSRHLQRLPVTQFRNVLDAGCGSGIYTRKLTVAYPHMELTRLDVKEFAPWSESPKNVQFKQQDLTQLSEENYYDFSYCIDVLQHIPGNRLVLEKIYRSLKPGDYFYLHMPLLKLWAQFDIWFPKLGEDAICLVGQKPVPNNNDPGISLRSIERTILSER